MAYASSVSVNVDAVTEETVANATGDALFQLGKNLVDAVSRLRRHLERAQAALDDAHNAPSHIQDAAGAELAAAQERMERLLPLAIKASVKFEAEAVAHFGLHRRRPAIDLMTCDSWDIIDDAASVFDVDQWSTAETQTESYAVVDTDAASASFDLLSFDDDLVSDAGTVHAESAAEDERPPAAAARRRSATQRPSSSSAKSEAHEFGPSLTSSPLNSSSAQPYQQAMSVQQRWEQPAPTPWSTVPPPSSPVTARPTQVDANTSGQMPSSSTRPSAAAAVQRSQQGSVAPLSAASLPSSSSPASGGAQALPSFQSAAPPPPSAAELMAEAIYDMIDYDDRIYGYVGGYPVPVVPDDLQILSRDMLQDLEDEIRRRRREAVDDLALVQQRLKNTASDADEAIMALVTELSALEAAVAKADRLHRAALYEHLHRDPASGEFIEERETQCRLIEAERRRLEAGGAPIYWCRRDQDEARRVSLACPLRPVFVVGAACTFRRVVPLVVAARSEPLGPTRRISHARQQLRDLVHRQVLQRQGLADIPPCRVVHVSPFDAGVDDAELKRLMVHHGFDVDEESRVVEYKVTSSRKGRGNHYYGFVTFLHRSAAERCVRQLDPMGLDGHGGMTPVRERNDGSFGHVKLTFSFSNNEKINADAVRQLDALGAHAGRTSSQAPRARRQPRAATPGRRQPRAATPGRRQPSRPAYDSDSNETDLEDH